METSTMQNETNTQFIDGLIKRVPELRPIYEEHLDDNDTLLPHVFMGAVARFVIERVRHGDFRHEGAVAQIMSAIDNSLKSNCPSIQELVSVSFVENLASETDVIQALVPLMGPNTQEEIQKY